MSDKEKLLALMERRQQLQLKINKRLVDFNRAATNVMSYRDEENGLPPIDDLEYISYIAGDLRASVEAIIKCEANMRDIIHSLPSHDV